MAVVKYKITWNDELNNEIKKPKFTSYLMISL